MSKFDGMTNAIDNWQSGLRDGFPLGIAYFAVAFAFGIVAAKSHVSIFDSFLISLTNLTSAGQFTGLGLIAAKVSYVEMFLTQIILNIRYLIMSCSLSQKYDADLPLIHRAITSFAVTDEMFGVVCCQPGKVSPFYTYGLLFMTVPSWCLGTVCGCFSGSLLPKALVSALGIVVYSLFFAIVVPPSKHDKVVRNVCVASMIMAVALAYLPYVKTLSSGMRIMIITLVVSGVAAILCPVKDDIAAKTAEATIKAHKEAMKVELYDE